MLKRLFVW